MLFKNYLPPRLAPLSELFHEHGIFIDCSIKIAGNRFIWVDDDLTYFDVYNNGLLSTCYSRDYFLVVISDGDYTYVYSIVERKCKFECFINYVLTQDQIDNAFEVMGLSVLI